MYSTNIPVVKSYSFFSISPSMFDDLCGFFDLMPWNTGQTSTETSPAVMKPESHKNPGKN